LADFTKLVALALETAEAHDQLAASRARILEASVAECPPQDALRGRRTAVSPSIGILASSDGQSRPVGLLTSPERRAL
jgi:hypothetical protein